MNKILVWGLLLFFLVGSISGCGTQDGSTTGTSTTVPASTAAPAAISLASSLSAGTILSQGGATTISATVTDDAGLPIQNGTIVSFTADVGTVSSSAVTNSGVAQATYQAGTSGGTVTITAATGTAGAVTNTLSIQVASGPAASITLASIAPPNIGVLGSGQQEISTITFDVTDNGGNPVTDGTAVDFTRGALLGGGESIFPASATTISGQVQVAVQSGSVAGPLTVTATITGLAVSTQANVTIVGGLPDFDHFSLAVSKENLLGYETFGLESVVSAFLADRYSNPVPVGTPVSFYSEGGFMVQVDSAGTPTNLVDFNGVALATHRTSLPYPDTTSTVSGTRGECTILATAEGQESFIDSNGSGFYDLGEPFTDLGEPVLDANDNGTFDVGEFYVDADLNGSYTAANGVWDSNIVIFAETSIIWNDNVIALSVVPTTGFNVPNAGQQNFTMTFTDGNGNPLPKDTTITVTSDKGTVLAGTTTIATGVTTHVFTVMDATPATTLAETAVITMLIDRPDTSPASFFMTGTVN